MNSNSISIKITGEDLFVKQYMILQNPSSKIVISKEVEHKINASRKVIDDLVSQSQSIYGVTTGFGNFGDHSISQTLTSELQENLIRSHAVGIGRPIPARIVRGMFALRINTLAKGFSGISLETFQKLVEAFNSNFLPKIYSQGTVGASGDLAPLAHLALGLMGEGKAYNENMNDFVNASEMLQKLGLTRLQLKSKEGLALINGTQFMSAIAAECISRYHRIVELADIVAALSFEALFGCKQALDPKIHIHKGHPGQIKTAENIKNLIHANENDFFDESNYKEEIDGKMVKKPKIQDGYSLRCTPQVHGICRETYDFVSKIIVTEMNSATDNPLVFLGKCPSNDHRFDNCDGYTVSGGNFHGEYVAKACDYGAIGVHEYANISERRINRLVDSNINKFLPSFLTMKDKAGLNSGFMIVQYAAASLVSENKVYSHPSSVDSIPTSQGQEDHVSMGGMSARKFLKVIENVENVLCMEIITSCQAVDLITNCKPVLGNENNDKLQKLYNFVRNEMKIPFMDNDISLSEHIIRLQEAIVGGELEKRNLIDLN